MQSKRNPLKRCVLSFLYGCCWRCQTRSTCTSLFTPLRNDVTDASRPLRVVWQHREQEVVARTSTCSLLGLQKQPEANSQLNYGGRRNRWILYIILTTCHCSYVRYLLNAYFVYTNKVNKLAKLKYLDLWRKLVLPYATFVF